MTGRELSWATGRAGHDGMKTLTLTLSNYQPVESMLLNNMTSFL